MPNIAVSDKVVGLREREFTLIIILAIISR